MKILSVSLICLFQEFPSGDVVPGADTLSDLVLRAADLAEQYVMRFSQMPQTVKQHNML